MARRKTSPLEDLLDVFFELAGVFWQVGTVMSIGFLAGGLCSIPAIEHNRLLTVLANAHPWIYLIIPLMFFTLSLVFGMKARYERQNY